jgi:hypothetical protein
MAVVLNPTHEPANGINGRGKKRDAVTVATGRVAGQDVTNQLTTAPDTK